MCRICRIFVLFSNHQTEAAKNRILKLATLKLTPNAVQVLRTPVDQEELCIELLIPDVKTDEEAEEAVKEIWNNRISGALKEFEHGNIQITI
jgi:CRISPR/Cas system-associated endonuclease Cas3-HD